MEHRGSRMQELAQTAMGRLATSQQELMELDRGDDFKDAVLDEHPLCEHGFTEKGENGMVRMDETGVQTAMSTLFKVYPSARFWDFKPVGLEVIESTLFDHSQAAFRMSLDQRAEIFAEQFARDPSIVGCRIELHDVSTSLATPGGPSPSISVYLYRSGEELSDVSVPITIRIIWRSNF